MSIIIRISKVNLKVILCIQNQLLINIPKNGRINMGKCKETDEKLNTYLRLATFPVGVKLLQNLEELWMDNGVCKGG